MGFAKGASLAGFVVCRIDVINTLDVLREMAQSLLPCMTKATMPGLVITRRQVDRLTRLHLQSKIIEVACRIILRFKDLMTLDAKRRAMFDSAIRLLVEDAHLPLSLEEIEAITLDCTGGEESC